MQQHSIFHGLLNTEGEGRVTETSWRLSYRKKATFLENPYLFFLLILSTVILKLELLELRKKNLASKFGLLAKLLLQPRFRVLM